LNIHASSSKLTLAVIPVGLFAAGVLLKHEHGPYYLRNNFDPEYNYLFNSLSLLTLHAPRHNDHPGVTLQILGAAVEWLKWLGCFLLGNRQSLSDSVLSRPESYLRTMNLVLNVLLGGALYWSASAIYKVSKSLPSAMLLQGTVVMYHQTFLALPRVSPEQLVVAIGLALMAVLAPVVLAEEGNAVNELRLATTAGALFGLGLMTKVTFAPWVAVVLLFSQKSYRKRFLMAAVATVLILLLPIATRIPHMASWFTSLATHSGSYGQGPVGLPAAHVLATSLFLLWQEESPFFWLFGLYLALLILLSLFRLQGDAARVRVRRAALRLLLAGVIAIVAATAMVTKHTETRYLLPALILTTFVNSTFCALALHSEFDRPAARWLCLAVVTAFLGIGLVRNEPFLRRWVDKSRSDQRSIAQVRTLEGRLSGCEIIGSYAPSLPIYALAFGSDYSGGVHWNALQKLYPGVIHYDPFGRRFLSFAFDQKIDDVKQMVKRGKCVLIESDPLDESTFNVFRLRDGIELETLTIVGNPFPPSEPTALYRLRPAVAAKIDP